MLRRYQSAPANGAAACDTQRVRLGTNTLDLHSRQLFDAQGAEIPLTRMEFDLLEVLVARPNRPMSRDQLLQLTQNRDWDPTDRSLDIRVARLRAKIEADPENPRLIRTVRGIGYRYVPDGPAGH